VDIVSDVHLYSEKACAICNPIALSLPLKIRAERTIPDQPQVESGHRSQDPTRHSQQAIQSLLLGQASDKENHRCLNRDLERLAHRYPWPFWDQLTRGDAAWDVGHGNGQRIEILHSLQGALADADYPVDLRHDEFAVEKSPQWPTHPREGIADIPVDEYPPLRSAKATSKRAILGRPPAIGLDHIRPMHVNKSEKLAEQGRMSARQSLKRVALLASQDTISGVQRQRAVSPVGI
jgi:hypothetical protein